ncbi:MAG: hypothetical protein II411_00545 [Lachnospiraceae bacterium]|nr:hypothetical protein [Lachnospiraceae bacterium]MBQ2204365.1 hypothetical protein [Lachnospiraceae bacterium]
MVSNILLPITTTMNTYNQMYQNKAKQRKECRRKEMEHQEHNDNGTSCAKVVIEENVIVRCFVSPIPPETPATMVTVCGI